LIVSLFLHCNCLQVFDMAEVRGFPPLELLDVGGGFTAPSDDDTSQLFGQTAAIINSSLDRWFPAGCGVRIISEPGR
jgi:ornithine decarboxylase